MNRRDILHALATISITNPNLIDHTVLTIESIFEEYTVYKTVRASSKQAVVAFKYTPDRQYYYYHYYDSTYPNRVEITDSSESSDIDYFVTQTENQRAAHQLLQDAEDVGLENIKTLSNS